MIRLLALLSVHLLPRLAAAWGAGHDDVAREVMSRLPEVLRAKLTPGIVEEAIKHDRHYPDSFQPFCPRRSVTRPSRR